MPLPQLVTAWVTVPDVSEALGVGVTTVRQYLREGKLIALRESEGEPLRIPADFVQGGEILKSLPSVIGLLRDGRFSDDEIVDWLYRPDDSLPGTPVQALRDNRGTEVKRRAQAER